MGCYSIFNICYQMQIVQQKILDRKEKEKKVGLVMIHIWLWVIYLSEFINAHAYYTFKIAKYN